MNTPTQQAELYRKAAETIEMCAKHGIEPCIKHMGVFRRLASISLNDDFCKYEFPIAVIEGQLVWKGTPVYDEDGNKFEGEFADRVIKDGLQTADHKAIYYKLACYTITPPKQPLCEVEGKPVYKGDTLYMSHGVPFKSYQVCKNVRYGELAFYDEYENCKEIVSRCSWNPPKRTVMVECDIDDAKKMADAANERLAETYVYDRVGLACRKALELDRK